MYSLPTQQIAFAKKVASEGWVGDFVVLGSTALGGVHTGSLALFTAAKNVWQLWTMQDYKPQLSWNGLHDAHKLPHQRLCVDLSSAPKHSEQGRVISFWVEPSNPLVQVAGIGSQWLEPDGNTCAGSRGLIRVGINRLMLSATALETLEALEAREPA